MGFLRNTGVRCHILLQGDLPDPGIEPPSSCHISCIAGRFIAAKPLEKPLDMLTIRFISQVYFCKQQNSIPIKLSRKAILCVCVFKEKEKYIPWLSLTVDSYELL